VDEGSDAGAASEPSQWSDEEEYGAQDFRASVEALPVEQVPTVADNEELDDTTATISAESAELATKSTLLMDTYAAVAEELRRVGAVALAANVIREQRKEARRVRKVSELDTGVLVALSHTRDAKAAEERKRMRLLAELLENRHSLSATKDALEDARAQLRVKKRAHFETELALEAKRAVKAFSLYELGDGRTRSGGAEGKRNRAQVLDRLVRLGQGISPAQRLITLGSKMPGAVTCWQNTEMLDPRSLQAGRSVWCRSTKEETEPQSLSSCTTKPSDALGGSSHSWLREAP
jgi:hypothetical protein